MLRLLAIAPCLFLAACSNLLSQKQAELAPSHQDKKTGEMLTLPAQLRTVVVRPRDSTIRSCAEPGPDVALSDTFKLVTAITAESTRAADTADASASSATSSQRKSGLSNELQSSTTALELAGRTQTVLLAREFLYRTCEAAANGWLEDTDVRQAHAGTLKHISEMVAADKQKAETAGALAVASAAVQLDAKVLLNTSSAVRAAIQSACLARFESCAVSAATDDAKKACRAGFAECNK